ncbi:MAG TPA: hypothetical protein DCM86_18250 [Verrucomicrobiales bacterium]|nr:hypothetical protein [Verrucomicrobiales bacterium]
MLAPAAALWIGIAWIQAAEEKPAGPTPGELLTQGLQQIVGLIEPAPGTEPRVFSTGWEVTRSEGLPKELSKLQGDLAIQAPDHARGRIQAGKQEFRIGRDGQELWVDVPGKKFGVVGKPGLPRFLTAPEKIDTTTLGPIKLPVARDQIALLPFFCDVKPLPEATLGGVPCRVIAATPKPEAIQALHLPAGTLTLSLRPTDSFPLAIAWADGGKVNVEVTFRDPKFSPAGPADQWKLVAAEGEKVETTAVSHLLRAVPVLVDTLSAKIPTLGPATGDRRVVATEGRGRLEMIDGTRLLYLEGTPEEMGRQHGVLMKKPIHDLVERVLYGVGVGSSFDKGRWFFGEIEEAQKRIGPFIDDRYLREMDSLAMAARLDREEVRLANFFPELFHCSGFAVFGDATVGGRLYHGRILDYLRGVGLEQNAVVMVFKPDQGNAWVNVSYAGFVGSVTAMNEKKLAIGEMGGRGEGNWDGKPMAQLVREVMEKASTLDEAVEIMRKGPRTCEYYYVISDGKTKRAVGIAATPTTFETIWSGQSHPKLPHAIKDAVLMSAGDRYETLAKRVQEGYGKLDESKARDLMTRPVCMGSNIHSVLFSPETLELWVANADSQNVASHARYTHYNLAELLAPASPAPASVEKRAP